jgi:uncharacterized protein YndB with AHSA1/START domain
MCRETSRAPAHDFAPERAGPEMPHVFVDRAARAYARRNQVIAATPDLVWAVLSDLSHWPDWNPGVRNMRLDGPVARGTEFHWTGGGHPIHSRLETVLPLHEIAWTGRAPGIRARHAWVLTPERTGTRVSTEEDFEGPLARMMPRTITRAIEKALEQGLDALAAECARRRAERPAA